MFEENKPVKKHPWPLLLFAIIFLGIVGYWVFSFSPTYTITLQTYSIPLLIPFFILLFAGLYALVAYLTISFLQGLIVASAILVYLLLRFFGITHPLFGLLLLAMVVSIEFAIYKRK